MARVCSANECSVTSMVSIVAEYKKKKPDTLDWVNWIHGESLSTIVGNPGIAEVVWIILVD